MADPVPNRGGRGPWSRTASLWLALALLASCGISGPFVALDDEGEPAGVPIDVRFDGVAALSESRILRVLEDRLLDLSRTPDSLAVVQDAAFDVEDLYRQEGFAKVTVDARIEPDPGAADADARLLVLDVTEGPQVTVRSMQLQGADEFSREELLEFWLRRGAGTFGFGDPLFVESDVLGFAESLRLFLRGNGYLDARVGAPGIDWIGGGDEVEIRIEIDAGAAYRVGRISVDPAIEAALGDAAIDSPAGGPAEAHLLDAYRTAIREALRKRGRPEPRVRLGLSRVEREVEVDVQGDPGPLAVVDSVEVAGLEATSEGVVRTLIELEDGELFDGSKLDDSLRELYLTGLFRRIDVEYEWLGEPSDDPRRLRIRLVFEELETRKVELLVGYGSYERARTKLRFEESNLFGSGRGLVLEGRLSQKGWRGLATVSDRNLLGTGIRTSISADAYEREEPSFVDTAYGGTLSFTREIAERTTARIGYTYRLHTGLESEVLDPAATIREYTEGSPFVEARYDSRDSPIYPRQGLHLMAQIDGNHPDLGADIDFLRARVAAAWYAPLDDDVGLALRAESGWLWPGDGSTAVPLPERFYNGGESSVRSFDQSDLGPKDPNGRALGGEYRNVFGAELRARLFRTLEGAVFADAGNLGSDVDRYGLSDLRYALGFGLRLALPIGPIRADAGWNPDRRSGEDAWVVHLSVGYPF